MKIGLVCGVNECENRAFLEELQRAWDSLQNSGEELEVLTAQPDLKKPYLAVENEAVNSYQTMTAVCERLCDAICNLKQSGAQEVIVLLGAQKIFPIDYIMERTGAKLRFDMCGYMRDQIKGVARRDRLAHSGFDVMMEWTEKNYKLGSIGVMGLSALAEAISGSDYLEEHIEKTSFSLATPINRQAVWQQLSRAFYVNVQPSSLYHKILCKFCLDETMAMDDCYRRAFGGLGLGGLLVTDFWTESLFGVEYDDGLVGKVMLPNNTVLPVISLEKVEAWSIISELIG